MELTRVPDSHWSMAWQLSQAIRAKKVNGMSNGQSGAVVWVETRVRVGRMQPAVKSMPTRNSFETSLGRRGESLRLVWTRVR